MLRDVEVEDAAAVVGKYDEDEQNATAVSGASGAAGRRCAQRLIWRLTRGRPAAAGAESLAQYSRKRRRCHRRTVLGDTMTRACLQPVHILDNATQNSRSLPSNFGRFTVFL
jgi:hypothetical protein